MQYTYTEDCIHSVLRQHLTLLETAVLLMNTIGVYNLGGILLPKTAPSSRHAIPCWS